GHWPRWRGALHAPRVNPDVLDSRFAIANWVEQGLTLADARQLLPHLRTLYLRDAEAHRPDHLPDYLVRAVELVLGESPPDPNDIDALLRFVTEVVGETSG